MAGIAYNSYEHPNRSKSTNLRIGIIYIWAAILFVIDFIGQWRVL